MPIYNLKEYRDINLNTSGSLWQCFRHESALANNKNIIDFPANDNNSILFRFKLKLTGETRNDGTKDVEIMVSLKNLSNF